MDIGKTYERLVHAGVRPEQELSEKLRIIRTNKISLLLAVISLIFGVVYYMIAGHIAFIIATNVEAIIFCTIVYLNDKGRSYLAGIILQGIITAAVVFFGIILGKAVEVYVLAIFLCGGSLLFLKFSAARIAFLIASVFAVLAIEFNKYYEVIPAFTFSPGVFNFIKYSSVTVVLALTILAIWHYVNSNKKLVTQLEQQNDHLEEMVEERTEELQKALLSKSIFIRELTHELRTPLNTILCIAQFKIEPNYAENREDNVNLYAACHNTLQIVNNTLDRFLLEYSKKPAIARQWININDFGRQVLQAFHYIAMSAEVKLELEIAGEMPKTVYEIEPYLRQIVSNLLGNAIKYTTAGTAVKLKFGLMPSGDKWMMAVIDNGPGIPLEQQSKIFEEYARLSSDAVEGIGVGLANSKSYALLLGGDIQVRSTQSIPGIAIGETAFTVTLPVIKFNDGSQPEAIRNYPVAKVKFNGLTALVVEDNQMNRVLLMRYIRDLGFNILEAEDGEKGLALAREYQPSIIITDVRMPQMGGKEMLMHVRKDDVLKDTPIIFCSGENGADLQIEKDALSKFVQKPLHFPVLHRAIQELLLAELVGIK